MCDAELDSAWDCTRETEDKDVSARLSAEQRAEKIANQVARCIKRAAPLDDAITLVAAEIREAVEEANELNRREIEVAHKIVEGVKALNDKQLEIAREAYEDAARILSSLVKIASRDGAGALRRGIELIRARAKELK